MIPSPKSLREFKKKFWVSERLFFIMDERIPPDLYDHIQHDLGAYYTKVLTGRELDAENPTVVEIALRAFKQKVPPDYYHLKVDANHILLEAESTGGLLCGVQTLKQHFLASSFNFEYEDDPGVDMQCLEIRDWPSFQWRGLHLDVSRHFFDHKFVYRYLDWMAALKLNKFHWHLSDDQGWRIESQRFPLLQEKGAWRKEQDGTSYGGYYTRHQIKLVVEYAARRGIEVIPEIDLPGHAMALLAAYPELACFPRDFETLSVWGVSEDIICAGKDSCLEFLKELLTEVAELFPGQYIHLGGDEAPKDRWKACPHCQQRIRKHKLSNEEELQSWLFKALAKHLQGLGKTVIGWDEILDGNIDSKPVVMCWRGDGTESAHKAHANGNRYVICPNNRLYFDWRPHKYPDAPGSFGITTIRDVYELDLGRFRFDKHKLFLGGQANLWTEHVTGTRTVKELFFGRAEAMAELFWSDPKTRDFDKFIQRVMDLRLFG